RSIAANIFLLIQKQRSLPHLTSSATPGKLRQISRIISRVTGRHSPATGDTIQASKRAMSDKPYEPKSEEEWRKTLTPEQFQVLRQHATEQRGTSPLNKEKREGTFLCAGCGQELFSSDTKFESGTGWPSFWKPKDEAVGTTVDKSYGMSRVEVHCS